MPELQWYRDPGEPLAGLIAKASPTKFNPWFIQYFGVREIDSGWVVSDYRNDLLEDGWSRGVYPTIEAAMAAANEFANPREVDPTKYRRSLLEVLEWAKEAGEQEVVDKYQAEYDASFRSDPGPSPS